MYYSYVNGVSDKSGEIIQSSNNNLLSRTDKLFWSEAYTCEKLYFPRNMWGLLKSKIDGLYYSYARLNFDDTWSILSHESYNTSSVDLLFVGVSKYFNIRNQFTRRCTDMVGNESNCFGSNALENDEFLFYFDVIFDAKDVVLYRTVAGKKLKLKEKFKIKNLNSLRIIQNLKHVTSHQRQKCLAI